MQLTLLTNDDAQNTICKMDLFKMPITDLAVIRGGMVRSFENNEVYFARAWLKEPINNNKTTALTPCFNNGDLSWPLFDISPVIYPVISISEVPNFKNLKTNKNEYGITEVEFGFYPQDIADVTIRKKLEIEFNKTLDEYTGKYIDSDFRETKESYTFSDTVVRYYQEGKMVIEPVVHPVYLYKGEKYVRVHNNCTCINDKYRQRNYWVKVMPVKWQVFENEGIIVSKKGLVSGVPFNKKTFLKNTPFEKTLMYKFLNDYMIKDLLQSVDLTKENKASKEMLSEIDLVLKRLEHNLSFLENYPKKDEFQSKVYNVIDAYNKKIESKKNRQPIILGEETIDDLKYKLQTNLENIDKEVENITVKVIKCQKLIDYIDALLNLLEKNKTFLDTSLKKDFQKIACCLSFLEDAEQSELKDKFESVLNDEKNKILMLMQDIVNQKNVTLEYENEKELEHSIRKNIHPLLNLLNDKAVKRNIYLEINQGIKDIIKHIYINEQKSLISFYINLINEVYENITKSDQIDNETKNYVLDIMNTSIDTNMNIEGIISQLVDIIKKLYAVQIRLEFEKEKEEKLENSFVRFKFQK